MRKLTVIRVLGGGIAAVLLSLALAASAGAAFPGQNGQIAFERIPGGSNPVQLLAIGPGGGSPTTLDANPLSDLSPSYSADGDDE